MTLAAALLLALTASQVDGIRERAVRHVVGADKPPQFRAYCLSIQNYMATLPASREGKVDQLLKRPPEDANELFLRRLHGLPHRIVPGSSCEIVVSRGDEEVAESGKPGPALQVVLGPVEAISDDRARLVIFTRSGSLTKTLVLYELDRKGADWQVTSTTILLQE